MAGRGPIFSVEERARYMNEEDPLSASSSSSSDDEYDMAQPGAPPSAAAAGAAAAKDYKSNNNTTTVGCQMCGRDDDHPKMLMCDGCNSECHMYCLAEPLAEVPDGEWFCDFCSAKKPPPAAAVPPAPRLDNEDDDDGVLVPAAAANAVGQPPIFAAGRLARATVIINQDTSRPGGITANQNKTEPDDGLDADVQALPKTYTDLFGSIVWAYGGSGFYWWPSCVYDPRKIQGDARTQARKYLGRKHLVYFFRCDDDTPFDCLELRKIKSWEEGISLDYHMGLAMTAANSRRPIPEKRRKQFAEALMAAVTEMDKPMSERLQWDHLGRPLPIVPSPRRRHPDAAAAAAAAALRVGPFAGVAVVAPDDNVADHPRGIGRARGLPTPSPIIGQGSVQGKRKATSTQVDAVGQTAAPVGAAPAPRKVARRNPSAISAAHGPGANSSTAFAPFAPHRPMPGYPYGAHSAQYQQQPMGNGGGGGGEHVQQSPPPQHPNMPYAPYPHVGYPYPRHPHYGYHLHHHHGAYHPPMPFRPPPLPHSGASVEDVATPEELSTARVEASWPIGAAALAAATTTTAAAAAAVEPDGELFCHVRYRNARRGFISLPSRRTSTFADARAAIAGELMPSKIKAGLEYCFYLPLLEDLTPQQEQRAILPLIQQFTPDCDGTVGFPAILYLIDPVRPPDEM